MTVSLTAERAGSALKRAALAASKLDLHTAQCGVQFIPNEEGSVTLVATDGYRISRMDFAGEREEGSPPDHPVIVNAQDLAAAAGRAGRGRRVSLSSPTPAALTLRPGRCGDKSAPAWSATFGCIEATYPAWAHVIPRGPWRAQHLIAAKDLADAAHEAAQRADKEAPGLFVGHLHIDQAGAGQLIFWERYGQRAAAIGFAASAGQPGEVGINVRYLSDGLRVVGAKPQVRLSMPAGQEPHRLPVLLSSPCGAVDGVDAEYALMPVDTSGPGNLSERARLLGRAQPASGDLDDPARSAVLV